MALQRRAVGVMGALWLAACAPNAHGEGDVRLISQGREVTLEQHLVPGKLVIFDFFADWCAPCRVLTPRLERLVAQYPDRIALRTIDVINWQSPVARQHGVSSLPHLVLYGGDGGRLAAGGAERVMRVVAAELGQNDGITPAPRRRSRVPWPVWPTAAVVLIAGSLLLRKRAGDLSPARSDAGTAHAPDDGPKIWFVMIDRKLEGPFSSDQLSRRLRDGRLRPTAAVRRRGEADWTPLGDVVGRD